MLSYISTQEFLRTLERCEKHLAALRASLCTSLVFFKISVCLYNSTVHLGVFFFISLVQCNCCYQGHPDNINQSQGRTETIDSNISSSANEMSRTEQWNFKMFQLGIYCFFSALWLVYFVYVTPVPVGALLTFVLSHKMEVIKERFFQKVVCYTQTSCLPSFFFFKPCLEINKLKGISTEPFLFNLYFSTTFTGHRHLKFPTRSTYMRLQWHVHSFVVTVLGISLWPWNLQQVAACVKGNYRGERAPRFVLSLYILAFEILPSGKVLKAWETCQNVLQLITSTDGCLFSKAWPIVGGILGEPPEYATSELIITG